MFCQQKNDSIFSHQNNEQVLNFSIKQSEVYADNIKEEFRKGIYKFDIGKIILKELEM
jgi:hypothetical protein